MRETGASSRAPFGPTSRSRVRRSRHRTSRERPPCRCCESRSLTSLAGGSSRATRRVGSARPCGPTSRRSVANQFGAQHEDIPRRVDAQADVAVLIHGSHLDFDALTLARRQDEGLARATGEGKRHGPTVARCGEALTDRVRARTAMGRNVRSDAPAGPGESNGARSLSSKKGGEHAWLGISPGWVCDAERLVLRRTRTCSSGTSLLSLKIDRSLLHAVRAVPTGTQPPVSVPVHTFPDDERPANAGLSIEWS